MFPPKNGEDTYGLEVIREIRRNAAGKESAYWMYGLPDAICVMGLTKNREIIAIDEFQMGVGAVYPHLVGGTVEKGEDPAVTATRELLEETGYRPEQIEPLPTILENSGKSHRAIHSFVAYDCEKITEPEAGIKVRLYSPLAFWECMMSYLFTTDVVHHTHHGGSSTLKLMAMAYNQLGWLKIKD